MPNNDNNLEIQELIDSHEVELSDIIRAVVDVYLDSGASYNEVLGALDSIKFNVNCESMEIGED